MPTYNYECTNGHVTERFCWISEHNANPRPPCPHEDEGTPCGAETKQIFLSAPHQCDTTKHIMAYKTSDGQSSRRFMAGHVHSYVDPGPTKVSVGAAGQLNPSHRPLHPAAKMFQPEWKGPVGPKVRPDRT